MEKESKKDVSLPKKRMRRSREDRMIAGVCSGIAEYYGWESWQVRVVFLLASTLSVAVPGVTISSTLWLFIKKSPWIPRPLGRGGKGFARKGNLF